MTDIAQLQDTIVGCERKVWDALVAGDKSADAQALADDFLGVYPAGQADKASHTGQLDHGPTVLAYQLTGHQFRLLAPQIALLSYHAVFQRVGRDKSEAMYVTSIWEHRTVGWVNIFSQDTPA